MRVVAQPPRRRRRCRVWPRSLVVLGLLVATVATTAVHAATSLPAPANDNAQYDPGTVGPIVPVASGFEACPEAPSTPKDRRKDPTRLTYATYNAEFLFLTGYGQLKCPGADCKWPDAQAAQAHVRAVAKSIRALDADILQLDEIEDCAALRALITELTALGDDTYRPYLVAGTDSATGQNVGLLTRVDPSSDLARSEAKTPLPVANSTCSSKTRANNQSPSDGASYSKSGKTKRPRNKDDDKNNGTAKAKGVAKHFYTTFKVPGFAKPLTVIGAHLLANPQDSRRCVEREGQAAVLAAIAKNATARGHHVILSGDLNDWSNSAPDRNDDRPISNALGLLEAPGFTNAASKADKGERYTQWFDRNKDCAFTDKEVSSLDHVIVSDSLLGGLESVAFRHDLYNASCQGFDSDHFPITVTFHAV